MPGADICFLATGKSGLGHLRRSATIARCLRRLAPERRLHLVSNAPPLGVTEADLAAFDSLQVQDRGQMAQAAAATDAGVLVLDTLTVPGIETSTARLALVLREAPDSQLHRFRLAGGRAWDLVVIANPRAHWMPPGDAFPARAMVAAGWIYRPTGRGRGAGAALPQVLVATGGGGTADTAAALYADMDAILRPVRQSGLEFEVVQAIGPRARSFGHLASADRCIDPGAELNALFREADVVISTAGYNSVLELATTDAPVLLVPIPRSIDDQAARARVWAPLLGYWHDADRPHSSSDWLKGAIAARLRRAPVDLGPSGEETAARAILDLP